jgi:hypothetical protein
MEYSNNDILFENDKYLAIKSPNMEEGLKVGPEFLTTTRHGKDVYNNRTVYFFINKEEKDTRYGIITLAFGEYFEVYDNYGDDIQLRDAFHYFPDLDKTITDIVGNVDLITTLVLIENGKKFSDYQLKQIDSNIKSVQYTRIPDNCKIYLEFTDSAGILSLMDFDSNDLDYIETVLSRYGYSSNLWELDTDYDWDEGNILGYFNDGSKELLDKIVSYIKPEFFNWRDDYNIKGELCELLYKQFDDEIRRILDDYSNHFDKAGYDALRKELYSDFCSPFEDYKIFVVKENETQICFYEYRTWVSQLKDLLIKTNTSTIEELITKLSEFVGSGLRTEIYEYPYRGEFDTESFNREVEYELENIIDKIEENPEKYSKNLSENLKLIQIIKKYQLNTPVKIDDERGSFIITGIKDGKLLVTHIKKNGVTKYKSFNLEEFNNFMSMGELFEHLIKKLKRML